MEEVFSEAEMNRYHIIRSVLEDRLKQVVAAKRLDLSDRQVRTLCGRVQEEGPRGIVHRLKGRPSNHQLPAERLELALCALQNPLWHDFGPKFAQQQLAKRLRLKIGRETLRQLMIQVEHCQPRHRGTTHRAWREPRPMLGMMTQLDGSDHDWFEGRAPRCALLTYVDDATSRLLYGRFVPVENTLNLMGATWTYVKRYGCPGELYVDKDGIYKVNRQASVEEELRDEQPLSQFTRAMTQLGVRVNCAHSPQAKGRVERGFDTHQDRLVKELRLRNISSIEEANRYLEDEYIAEHNAAYARPPARPGDAHRPLSPRHDLAAIFSIQKERLVHRDSVVRFASRFYLLAPGHGLRPKTTVVVEKRLDGTMRIAHKGRYFAFKEVQTRPYLPLQPRRASAERQGPAPITIKLPRNPFFGIGGGSPPTNSPAAAVAA